MRLWRSGNETGDLGMRLGGGLRMRLRRSGNEARLRSGNET